MSRHHHDRQQPRPPPTGPMRPEAVEAARYHSDGWNRDFPRVQILTVNELLSGTKPDVPPMRRTFERAQRIRSAESHRQASLIGAGDLDLPFE